MATISEALAIALHHHRAGRLQAADQIYRQILISDPDHVEALHLLGVIAQQLGQHEVAVEYIGRAIKLKGTEAAFHSNLSNAFKDLGKLDEAVACCRQALGLNPAFAEAHNNLGNALQAQGKHAEAITSCRRALELNPAFAEAHNNLGNALQAQGKHAEAITSCRRALELNPAFAEAHNNLGNALQAQGKHAEAITSCRRALELNPAFAEAHNNLGNALQAQEKLDEALDCYLRALELKPRYAEAHNNLGNALQVMDKLAEAVACYRKALELKPGYAEAYNNLGDALRHQGKLGAAFACCRRALELNPAFAEAHNNLGNALQAQGKLDDAVVSYHRALELKPTFSAAHNNLGNALQAQGKLSEAVACFHRALELKPAFAEAHNNLGNTFKDRGGLDEAVTCYHKALELKPIYAKAYNNLLLTLQYRASTLAELAVAHGEYERIYAAPLRSHWRPHEIDSNSHRPFRIGFVSPDFGRHAVGYFLIRALENLDRRQWEVICYCDRIIEDDLTNRFQAAATTWRNVSGSSDDELTAQIRTDRIDILFDLAGHTARNRLLVFARKPAPIQVTWAGYVGTTGLQAMDYILADQYEIPRNAEADYCEKVLRMPDGYVCYDPPSYAPFVSPLPAEEQGYVTFGSFNNPAKITSHVVKVWASILHRLPQSRLVLKYKGINDVSVATRLAEEFASQGIGLSRLDFLGHSPHPTLLAEYHNIDLALDPFPYNGGLTTCEALWMGVPVITCPGETFASRHSLSHLSNVGLTETIARDLDDYVHLAASMAAELPQLATLRAGLRDRMASSPLCNGKRFATNLMLILGELRREKSDANRGPGPESSAGSANPTSQSS